MDFFNIGPTELLLILVVALIVFGPGKLPEMAGKLGRAVRELRRAQQSLTNEFSRELRYDEQSRASPTEVEGARAEAPSSPSDEVPIAEIPSTPGLSEQQSALQSEGAPGSPQYDPADPLPSTRD